MALITGRAMVKRGKATGEGFVSGRYIFDVDVDVEVNDDDVCTYRG
jgi:hypothetical protein